MCLESRHFIECFFLWQLMQKMEEREAEQAGWREERDKVMHVAALMKANPLSQRSSLLTLYTDKAFEIEK